MGARPVAVPDPEVDIAEALDLVADIAVVREDAAEVRPHLVAVPDADDEADEPEDAVEIALFEEPAAPTHANETVTIAAPQHRRRAGGSEPAVPAAERKAPARKPKARKGRASVPSWDEILFGAHQVRRLGYGPNGSGWADMCWRCDRAAVVRDR